jgi:CelD/BcsL family acetyltransferase involved in cellulose biosynthesis
VTVQVRVVRPGELGESERSAWRACQRSGDALASPFLSPEFALAVDSARDDARVAVVDGLGDGVPGGGGLAFFAFSVDDAGDGTPVGATICDAQAFVTPSDVDWDARALIGACGLRSWRFDHLVSTQRLFAPFHDTRHASPVAELTAGHDAYLRAVRDRSKDVLAQTGRRRRKLAREVGDVAFEWNDTDAATLDQLLAWKSDQYRATGVWDRFDQPWIVDVVRMLAATTSEGLTGVTSTLRAGGELVAVHFGLLGRDRVAWWFPAYDPEFASYSPGLLLLLDLVAESARRGLRLVDLGRGKHHYKLRVATGSYDVAEGVVPALD